MTSDRQAAWFSVNEAVRRGLLVRPEACPKCGRQGRVDGHHHDYSKPLDVEWLCRQCHRTAHGRGANPNGPWARQRHLPRLQLSLNRAERASIADIERRLGVRASRAIAIAIQHTLVDLRNREPLNQVEPEPPEER